MTLTQAALVATLTTIGVYMLMHRTLVRIILGVGMLGNAVNLLIVAAGGPVANAPIVGVDGRLPTEVSDPVPQALVLTAIVIGFAVISFLLSIAYRSWTINGTDEVEDDIEDRRISTMSDSVESGSLESGSSESGSLESGSLESGS